MTGSWRHPGEMWQRRSDCDGINPGPGESLISMDDKRGRFKVQVLPHLDAAYRYARWLARSPNNADDVLQEATLRAYRSFDDLRGADGKAWLLTIVRNCYLTAAKQQQRRRAVPLPEEDDDSGGAM